MTMILKTLSIVIVTHVYATGPAFKLEEYLRRKAGSLVFIGHPFSYTEDTRSFLRIYKKGKLVAEKTFLPWAGPEIVFYIKDILLTLWWVVRFGKKIDYFFGVDNLNVFAGYLLQLVGRVKQIIFYTIDYIPQRFENNTLNNIYHALDRLAVAKSYKVWNLSPVMVKEREKKGISQSYRDKQITVPIGTEIPSNRISALRIDRYKFVFMGHLREGQGVEMLISIMPDIVKKVPKAHLLIIGGGPLENELREKVKKLKLEKNVQFSGFVKDFVDVEVMLQDAAFAVAPYVDDKKTFTRNTDPGKPKDYLASGLPVIITKVPQVAYEIADKKCGIAINFDKDELIMAVEALLRDDILLRKFRHNAIGMAKQYTWEKIFEKAVKETI